MSDVTEQRTARRRRRARRAGLWSLLGVVVLAAAAVVYGMSLLGTQVRAPDWLRDKIVQQVNRADGGYQVSFGEVSIIMSRDWVPRLMLRDVQVSRRDGEPLITLSDIQGTVALRPLMNGELHPASVYLSGAQVLLRRASDGTVDLTVGESGSTVDRAPGMVALIEELDRFLLRSQFAELDRAEADNLTIRYEDARAGRAWTVDGGRLALNRDGDTLNIRGDFALLGGRDYATTLDLSYRGRLGDTAAEFGFSFEDMPAGDIAGQSPALAWLGALEAPISGALRGSIDADGDFGPLNATLQIGAGVLQPTEVTRPIAFTGARSYFTYDPDRQRMRIDEFSVDSDWGSAQAEGTAYLVGVENGLPQEILSQVQVTRLIFNPPGLYPAPVSIDGATLDMRLRIDPFALTLGEMSFADGDARFVLNGDARADEDGWHVALDGRLDRIGPVRLMELWPETLKADTREWVVENVETAQISNVQLALRSVPGHKPDIFLGFDFRDLKTRFMKGMPPLEAAAGHASLYGNRFAITADEGSVIAAQGGRVDVTGTSFIVPSVDIRRGPARVILKTRSTITAALSLLDEEPLRFLQKSNQPVTLADGEAQVSGQLDFLLKPRLKTEEVAFAATARLTNVRSETLVPDRVISAAVLDVTADNDTLVIRGDGRIGTVPASGRWEAALARGGTGESHLTGWIELSERFAEEFRIGLPPGSLTGTGRAEVKLDFNRGRPGRFTLSSDMQGVGVRLQSLGWTLAKSARGDLRVEGALGEPPRIDSIRFDGGGLSAEGTVGLRADGLLDKASFTTVRIGTWLDAPVDLIGRGANLTPAVQVRGGRIDLRQTSLGGEGAARERNGGPVSLTLDRLQISDGIALTDFRAELDMARGVDGTFRGKVNDGTPIEGRVVPQGGRSAFRIKSANAGGVMRSAGLLKQARDGDMDLILTPATAPGSYNGKLTIEGFRLKDAPALAALMNAISVVGLLEQLDREGLRFSQVEARFLLTPQRVTLYESSAVGASLGISMDGYYYMQSGQMDMQGVFSPLYLVNAIGGIFTRKGEGLIGFNYTLKGSAEAPRVSVNPLSALTPAMFRDIFRRPPPRVQRGTVTQGGATSGSSQGTVDAPEQKPETRLPKTGTDR